MPTNRVSPRPRRLSFGGGVLERIGGWGRRKASSGSGRPSLAIGWAAALFLVAWTGVPDAGDPVALDAVASDPAGSENSSSLPTIEEILAAHCAAREDLVSLHAAFTQVRVFTLFEEEERSAGVFFYKQPRRALWRYHEPDSSSTVMNQDAGWTVLPDIKQVQKIGLGGSSTDRMLSIVGFGPCGVELTELFAFALLAADEQLLHLSLAPSDGSIAAYFTRIELFLDRGDFLPRKIILYDISDDRIEFVFTDLDTQGMVPDSLFVWSVPEDYEIVEY